MTQTGQPGQQCEKCMGWVADDETPLNPYWMNCSDRLCPRMRVQMNMLTIDKEVWP